MSGVFLTVHLNVFCSRNSQMSLGWLLSEPLGILLSPLAQHWDYRCAHAPGFYLGAEA